MAQIGNLRDASTDPLLYVQSLEVPPPSLPRLALSPSLPYFSSVDLPCTRIRRLRLPDRSRCRRRPSPARRALGGSRARFRSLTSTLLHVIRRGRPHLVALFSLIDQIVYCLPVDLSAPTGTQEQEAQAGVRWEGVRERSPAATQAAGTWMQGQCASRDGRLSRALFQVVVHI